MTVSVMVPVVVMAMTTLVIILRREGGGRAKEREGENDKLLHAPIVARDMPFCCANCNGARV
jgi:hypothetical protein